MAVFVDNLEPYKRGALPAALQEILARHGKDVCNTEYGKNLGKGLYEFRLRHTYDEIVAQHSDAGSIAPPSRDRDACVPLRVFFYPHGDKLILLLSAYDKGRQASSRRQDKEIKRARRFLADYKRRSGSSWRIHLGLGLGRWMGRRD
ncbi:MAG TPA: hypothetical protein ENH00_15000 [Actinobacteria bacterium]|nr:hypothetical protein BMS3Bbin01_02762 [bacterium BMS3Bbin01]HDH27470.1 hypothetical protein [Actinomycetota bacterium]